MPRPPVKKTRKLAQAQKEGEYKALTNFKSKLFKNKKQMQVWLYEKLDDLVKKIDPLELLAIGATTILIKTGIQWTEEVLARFVGGSAVETLYRMGLGVLSFLIPKSEEAKSKEEQIRELMNTPEVEIIEWGISFVVAFLVVRHGGEIIGQGGNILGVAKGLIGVIG